MPQIEQYILVAVLVETVVNLLITIYAPEAGKSIIQCINWKMVLSIIVGEFVAFGFGMNLMTVVGVIGAAPWMGIVLTGLLLSRGSNFAHDVIKWVNDMKQQATARALNKVRG